VANLDVELPETPANSDLHVDLWPLYRAVKALQRLAYATSPSGRQSNSIVVGPAGLLPGMAVFEDQKGNLLTDPAPGSVVYFVGIALTGNQSGNILYNYNPNPINVK
jgi:hypothetical protein